MSSLLSFPETLLTLFADDPLTRTLQGALIILSAASVYLLFAATRDIILRSRSLPFQLFCIVVVAAFPLVGYFLYLLIRPARTVHERSMERMLMELLQRERALAVSRGARKALRGIPPATVEHVKALQRGKLATTTRSS